MDADRPTPRLLGRTLIDKGIISEDQLRIALLDQSKSKVRLGQILVQFGFVSEATLRDALSENLGKRSIDLSCAVIDPDALSRIPHEFAKRHHLLPLDYDSRSRRLGIAIADEHDLIALDGIRRLSTDIIDIETVLAGEVEIDRAIDRVYGHALSIDEILQEIEHKNANSDDPAASVEHQRQPVIRLIDAILTDAVKREASDIHFEPEAGFLRIRYRMDGLLRQVRALHKAYWPAMAVRIKILSGMNIAETRVPQDGRMTLSMRGRQIDLRASCQPTLHGENIVLRILDRLKGLMALDQLGLAEAQLEQLKRMIERPEGIILITGPTGSGKTTTLYSILHHINAEGLNIMTLEDPVEYPMTRVRQTSIVDSARLDFANGIRSLLRQDPDVILVGEIRDADTAEMAFRAAMTGHQVYSSLHTNSALGAIPRLLDIGMLPDIMAGNIIGIIAQRLVRQLCPKCKIPYRASASEIRQIAGDCVDAPRLFRPEGCQYCEFQGYRGRLAIMEILRMNADIDELVARRGALREIGHLAKQQGFVSLAEDGLRRVLDGSTSLAELARIVDLSDRR